MDFILIIRELLCAKFRLVSLHSSISLKIIVQPTSS